MSQAITPTKANRIRALKAQHEYLTVQDIAKLGKYSLTEVRAALSRGNARRVKPRVR